MKRLLLIIFLCLYAGTALAGETLGIDKFKDSRGFVLQFRYVCSAGYVWMDVNHGDVSQLYWQKETAYGVRSVPVKCEEFKKKFNIKKQ